MCCNVFRASILRSLLHIQCHIWLCFIWNAINMIFFLLNVEEQDMVHTITSANIKDSWQLITFHRVIKSLERKWRIAKDKTGIQKGSELGFSQSYKTRKRSSSITSIAHCFRMQHQLSNYNGTVNSFWTKWMLTSSFKEIWPRH
jgi:hypothetical protein